MTLRRLRLHLERRRGAPSFTATAICLAVALAGCRSAPKLKSRCGSDADCPAGFACNAASGVCGCRSDAACSTNEFCNVQGFCQARVGCDATADCPPGELCDTTSRQCIDASHCTKDVQCPLGQVCSLDAFACVAGCRVRGDCPLGEVCRGADTDAGVAGTCRAGPCDDSLGCPWGDVCAPSDPGDPASDKTCQRDLRGPYCERCAATPGTVARCGDGPNFCLLDRTVRYVSTFCGVDCSAGQACPSGFGCRPILILTHGLCQSDADCPPHGDACQADADCPAARCDLASHRCAGKCSYNEDSKQGFCTCVADSECPHDACNLTDGRCAITRKPCTPDGTECDGAIFCKQVGARRACFIGKNCAPADGITCGDVLNAEGGATP